MSRGADAVPPPPPRTSPLRRELYPYPRDSATCTFAGRPYTAGRSPKRVKGSCLGSIGCLLELGSLRNLGVPWAGETVDLPVEEPQWGCLRCPRKSGMPAVRG
jgi:hypothetical protein